MRAMRLTKYSIFDVIDLCDLMIKRAKDEGSYRRIQNEDASLYISRIVKAPLRLEHTNLPLKEIAILLYRRTIEYP